MRSWPECCVVLDMSTARTRTQGLPGSGLGEMAELSPVKCWQRLTVCTESSNLSFLFPGVHSLRLVPYKDLPQRQASLPSLITADKNRECPISVLHSPPSPHFSMRLSCLHPSIGPVRSPGPRHCTLLFPHSNPVFKTCVLKVHFTTHLSG